MTDRRSAPRVLAVVPPFKETLDGETVARAFRGGIERGGAEAEVLVGSDGGDGLLEALSVLGVRRSELMVTGPADEPVSAPAVWLPGGEAVIESRHVCGLGLVPPARRQPGALSTRGLGELITQLGTRGARVVYVGLGGSATMDGGVGMASAWGWRLVDASGAPVPPLGDRLMDIARIEPGVRPGVQLVGLVDVQHQLLGPQGAARFAAQKGASEHDTARLEDGLARLAGLTALWGGLDAAACPGAGAAGGLGFGIVVFGGGDLAAGARWVLDRIGFAEALSRADLVLTGEGAFDDTSLQGKLPGVVLDAARAAGVPAGLVAPHAEQVPPGVLVETGPGTWDEGALASHVTRLVRRALRLPGR